MKKINLYLVAALVMGLSSVSLAQNSATATATGNASIIKPITLTWNEPLAFGELAAGNSAGSATIDITGVNVSNAGYINVPPTNLTGGVAIVTNSGPAFFSGDKNPGPAVFTVTGELNYNFGILLPPTTQGIPVHLINNTTSSPDLLLHSFTSVVGNPGVVGASGNLSHGTGFEFFAVGGTIDIPANATSGFYQGSFLVTVFYN